MDLHKKIWVPIPHTNYIIKYVFYKTGYNVLISNLSDLFCENADLTSVLKKMNHLNPDVKVNFTSILQYLEKALVKGLKEEAPLSIDLSSSQLVLSLDFPVDDFSCKYNFALDLDNSQMAEQLVGPLIFKALLCQKKIQCSEEISSSATSGPINPQGLTGKHVPPENLVLGFLKVQNSSVSEKLEAENVRAYDAHKKKMAKHRAKKVKLPAYWGEDIKNGRVYFPENFSGVSSIYVGDKKPLSPIKEELTCADKVTSSSRVVKKRKLHF